MKRKHIQNKNFKIWKYLDFTKFVSLLETDSLYFAKANTMIDRHEGIFNSDSKLSASCKTKKFKKTRKPGKGNIYSNRHQDLNRKNICSTDSRRVDKISCSVFG